MKKLVGFLCALVLSGALMTGCGGGSGSSTDFAALAVAFEDCSQQSVANLINVVYALVGIPDYIESEGDSPFPGFEVDASQLPSPPNAANSWSFSVRFDTNGNGIPDTTVSGTAVFSEDPADGLGPGATIQITFQVDNSALSGGNGGDHGTLTGSGNVTATLGAIPEDVTITGSASFADGACSADLDFALADPLHLLFFEGTPVAPQLAANLGAFEMFGTIEVLLATLGHEFDGSVSIEPEGQTATVTGQINGTFEVDGDFEIVPPDEVMAAMFGCAFITLGEWFQFFEDIAHDALNFIADGEPLPPGIVVAPAGPNAFDYTLDLALYDAAFTGGTITGRVTLDFPQLTGFPPNQATVTWTIANATFVSGDVTNGQNAAGRPLRFYVDADDLDDPVAFSGAGSFTMVAGAPPLVGLGPTMDCTITFDIPEDDPIVLDTDDDGRAIIQVTVDGNVMTLVIDIDEETLLTVNGVPLPFFVF